MYAKEAAGAERAGVRKSTTELLRKNGKGRSKKPRESASARIKQKKRPDKSTKKKAKTVPSALGLEGRWTKKNEKRQKKRTTQAAKRTRRGGNKLLETKRKRLEKKN